MGIYFGRLRKIQVPKREPVWWEVYLRRQSVSVVDPDRWLSPFIVLPSPPGLRGQKGVDEPGRSRLMSQNGSIVVETPLQEKEGRRWRGVQRLQLIYLIVTRKGWWHQWQFMSSDLYRLRILNIFVFKPTGRLSVCMCICQCSFHSSTLVCYSIT